LARRDGAVGGWVGNGEPASGDSRLNGEDEVVATLAKGFVPVDGGIEGCCVV